MNNGLKLGIPAVALMVLGGAVLARLASAAPEPDSLDYLVQDVCLDALARPTAGDPASCARRRNLRIGERIPYLLTDYEKTTGATYQASSSIPVLGADGRTMVLMVKSLEGSFGPDYTFSFSPARDAFDLIDVSHSGFASIVRTFDGGCLDQVFSRNGSRARMSDRSGGWILFPLRPAPGEWPRTQSVRHTTWRMQLSPRRGMCADNHAFGVTNWHRPARYAFESGKGMLAIRTEHFAIADLTQPENSFERYYFTREYGLTRWEAWQTLAYCQKTLGSADARCRPADPANPWHTRCTTLKEATSGRAGIANFGGQAWVRIFCRDQTHHIALKRPQLFLSADVGRGSGVVDIDFRGTAAKVERP